jgi:hypothetical protein
MQYSNVVSFEKSFQKIRISDDQNYSVNHFKEITFPSQWESFNNNVYMSTLFDATRRYSTLLDATRRYSTLLDATRL